MSPLDHARVLVSLARPPVLLVLALFAATGLAAGGAADRPGAVAPVMVAVTAFLVFAAIVNDLADEAIDRVNLPGVAGRPLVEGRADRPQLAVTAAVAAGVALTGAAAVGGPARGPALVVVAAGLALAAAYSLPPVRLAGRGAVAALVLPAGYVAVPYLLGLLAAGGPIDGRSTVLLAGLYVGFIGRILLKDFRDLRGDALFGKRTFLVRHGRVATCRFGAACWVAGAGTLVSVRDVTPALVASHLTLLAVALVLLRRLRTDLGPRRDEALIAAIALTGRGMVTVLVVHLAMVGITVSVLVTAATTAALTAAVLDQVRTMLRDGPRSRTTVPPDWSSDPRPRAAVGSSR